MTFQITVRAATYHGYATMPDKVVSTSSPLKSSPYRSGEMSQKHVEGILRFGIFLRGLVIWLRVASGMVYAEEWIIKIKKKIRVRSWLIFFS
jgi:hypothetical protein